MAAYAPGSFSEAFVLVCMTLAGWGSWSVTVKASGTPFLQFYPDYAVAVVLASVLATAVLGDADYGSGTTLGHVLFAAAGGFVFNICNVLVVAAIEVAGLALAFPVAVGIALCEGTALNYVIQPDGDPLLLFAGVAFAAVAIVCNGLGHRSLAADQLRARIKRPLVAGSDGRVQLAMQPKTAAVTPSAALVGAAGLSDAAALGDGGPVRGTMAVTPSLETDSVTTTTATLDASESTQAAGSSAGVDGGHEGRESLRQPSTASAGADAADVRPARLSGGLSETDTTTEKPIRTGLGVLLSIASGIFMGLWSPLATESMAAPSALTPYASFVVFTCSMLITTVPIALAMSRWPISGSRMSVREYVRNYRAVAWRSRLWPLLGGFVWALATLCNLVAGNTVGFAIAFSMGHTSPMVATLWGVALGELRGAGGRTIGYFVAMLVLFVTAIANGSRQIICVNPLLATLVREAQRHTLPR